MVIVLDLRAEGRGFEPSLGHDYFQIITKHSSYSTFAWFSIKWTGRHSATDSCIKCAWLINETKAGQTHAHNTFAAASMCLECLLASMKALRSLLGRLSLSVGWANGPGRGRKIVSFNLNSLKLKQTVQTDQMPHSAASDLGLHCLQTSQFRFNK